MKLRVKARLGRSLALSSCVGSVSEVLFVDMGPDIDTIELREGRRSDPVGIYTKRCKERNRREQCKAVGRDRNE